MALLLLTAVTGNVGSSDVPAGPLLLRGDRKRSGGAAHERVVQPGVRTGGVVDRACSLRIEQNGTNTGIEWFANLRIAVFTDVRW